MYQAKRADLCLFLIMVLIVLLLWSCLKKKKRQNGQVYPGENCENSSIRNVLSVNYSIIIAPTMPPCITNQTHVPHQVVNIPYNNIIPAAPQYNFRDDLPPAYNEVVAPKLNH